MKNVKRFAAFTARPSTMLFLGCCTICLSTPAYAYLDAGTASILLQSLLGGLAIVITSVSLFWKRIRYFLSRNKTKEESDDSTDDQESN